MGGSCTNRILFLCWLWLLTWPALGEPKPIFLNIEVEPSVVRLEAESPYSGPDEQPLLKQAAEQEIGGVFTVGSVGGPARVGQLKEVRVGPGTRRDEISGEALAENRQQTCLHAIWEFPYNPDSKQLVFSSGIKQSVDFVTHHLGVRLHDRSKLKTKQTLSLDGEDPWYSQFADSELVRTPAESIACYLYLEPGQTRLEVIARARDLQRLGPLDLGPETELSPEKQALLAEQAGKILSNRLGVELNERPLELQQGLVQFVNRTPTSADPLDPPQAVPVQLATLGAIFLGPAITEEGTLQLRCDLFGPRVRHIPTVVTQGDQVRNLNLLPDEKGLIELEAPPKGKVLSPVSAPQRVARGFVILIACSVLAVGAVLLARAKAGTGTFLLGATLWLLAGLGALKWGLGPDETVTKDRLQSLLENIYQAFDAHSEETVYDRLALSVEGELLSQVYLQTRKGLEAEKGVQVVVERVEVGSATVKSGDWWGDGMRVRAFWEVSGRVGHWGHEHQRTNLYSADLKLKSVGGTWKLTELEALDEIRM